MDVFKTHGAFSWSELSTPDPAAAARFYGALFGWSVKDPEPSMGDYRVASVGDSMVAGIMSPPPGAPTTAFWGVYVTVSDVEATMKKAVELGGKVIMPGMDVPRVGRMAVIQDPQGAVLSVMQYSDGQ